MEGLGSDAWRRLRREPFAQRWSAGRCTTRCTKRSPHSKRATGIARRDRRAAPAPGAQRLREARVRVRRRGHRPALHAHEVRAVAGAVAVAARRGASRRDDRRRICSPRPAELSRIGRRLLQVPRNLDVRLLHYPTRSVRGRASEQRGVRAAIRTSAACAGDVDRARRRRGVLHARRAVMGFSSPAATRGCSARSTSCWSAPGGDLFDAALRPAFDSRAGVWAAGCSRSCTTRAG